jgi:enoyl-CoA hydratase/carnithine racemase
VTFNNPERHNAVSLDMWEATTRILDDFAADDEVRAVVLTGAGGKAFVSGADISKFASERASLDATRAYDVTTAAAFDSIYEFPKPTIAMIRGYCIGGGVGVASCCDLRICSDNSRFAVPAAKLGSSGSWMSSDNHSPRKFFTLRANSTRTKPTPWVLSIVWCRRGNSKAM